LISVSNTWLEKLGYSRDEVIGRKPLDFFTEECKPRAREDISRFFKTGQAKDLPYQLIAKDGRILDILLSSVAEYDADGHFIQSLGVIEDITVRKRAEELREQIERIIQHDLRAPAGNAIQIARTLRDEMSVSDEEKRLLSLFENAGQNMLDTLDMSLDLYKIETGQYQNEPILFDCLPLIADIVEILGKNWYSTVNVDILVSGLPKTPDSLCFCRGVPKLLRIAIQNLLVNALEASPAGAKAVVEMSSNEDCRIAMRNQGVVPNEIRGRFFDKYVTRGKVKGTGLGTYSAKMMIEAQGGGIEMRTSDEANETVVTVRMPC
ncbi:MAG: PAS domain-containing sensor histidine kinase, partial [Desulfovibrionaceae bacterium]|nr:PAS domain-containing sensor histidine kinase [Desulfovibrionaceae bacterium]